MAGASRSGESGRGAALLELFEQGAALTRELEDENRSLHERLRLAEADGRQWAARNAEIEAHHNELANLYVASFQLHATLEPHEVEAAISEIVINLIGAEVFALYACSSDESALVPVAGEGRPLERFPRASVGEGEIGGAVARGALWIAPEADASVVGSERPMVVIPLRVRGSSLGAIAIFKLLDQKPGLSELDRQLFELLSSHAAMALLCARTQRSTAGAARNGVVGSITN